MAEPVVDTTADVTYNALHSTHDEERTYVKWCSKATRVAGARHRRRGQRTCYTSNFISFLIS